MRTIWIVDAHREGTQFVLRADEKLTAFLELELRAKRAAFVLTKGQGKICVNKHKKR